MSAVIRHPRYSEGQARRLAVHMLAAEPASKLDGRKEGRSRWRRWWWWGWSLWLFPLAWLAWVFRGIVL